MNSHANPGDVIFALFQMDINKETIEENYKIQRLEEPFKRLGISVHGGGRAMTQSYPRFELNQHQNPAFMVSNYSRNSNDAVVTLWWLQ